MSGLTIEDYEEVLESHRKLVRELDVLLNGEGAATQASLCDLVGQIGSIVRATGMPLLVTDAPDLDNKQLILNNLANIDNQLDALTDFPVENSAQVMIGAAMAMLTETIELVKELRVVPHKIDLN